MQRQPKTILGGFLTCLLLVLAVEPVQSQQVSTPRNASQVPGPAVEKLKRPAPKDKQVKGKPP
jgi:hypothetical protein